MLAARLSCLTLSQAIGSSARPPARAGSLFQILIKPSKSFWPERYRPTQCNKWPQGLHRSTDCLLISTAEEEFSRIFVPFSPRRRAPKAYKPPQIYPFGTFWYPHPKSNFHISAKLDPAVPGQRFKARCDFSSPAHFRLRQRRRRLHCSYIVLPWQLPDPARHFQLKKRRKYFR